LFFAAKLLGCKNWEILWIKKGCSGVGNPYAAVFLCALGMGDE